MTTARLPCATAHAASVTDSFITIEPVRPLRTILAEGGASSSCRFSTSAMKATRASADSGMRTRTLRPSSACATPSPILRLITRATSRAVLKSLAFRSSCSESPCASDVGTLRSTVAPSGTRPAFRLLTCTFEPPAAAPAPPTSRLPCAIA